MTDVLFFPAYTATDVLSMDEKEVYEGYMAGLDGKPAPQDSRARWHGWRNGMMDCGLMPHDGASAAVAHDFVQNHPAALMGKEQEDHT